MKARLPIRVGVIGLGGWGKRHVQTLVARHDFDLVGVADVDAGTLRSVCDRYHLAGFADSAAMLEQVQLDAVVVATPDRFHRIPCERAALRGRAIFLEKPLADSVCDGEAIVRTAQEHCVPLMVGHTLRFDPRYIAVRQAVLEGKLGDLVHLYTRRNASLRGALQTRRIEGRGEAVVCMGVHDIDMVCWLTESRVTRVYAESTSKTLMERGVADTLVATLHLAGGTIAALETSWGLPAGLPMGLDAQLEVVGTRGAAYIDARTSSLALFTDGVYTQPDVVINLPGAHFLQDEYDCFRDYLAGVGPAVVGGEVSLAALRVAEAIVQSAQTGKPIDL